MNPDELICSTSSVAESRFSNLPTATRTQVHNSYSSFKTPHFVNNGALKLSATNTDSNLEDDSLCCTNIGSEVRALRKALNLPVDFSPNSDGLTSLSSHWVKQHGSKNGLVHLTDSGYSSKVYPQSVDAMQNGVALGYSSLGLDRDSNEVKNNSLFSSQELNSLGSPLSSSSFYERSLKSSLDESETKRMLLLEKLREAHLTIQNQAEKLAEGESEICFLRGQLKSIGIEQEGLQQEVDCLTMEKKTLEFFKSESLRNREEFLIRVNELDKALRVLTATHNASQTEVQKKDAVLEKTTSYVATLQQDNYRLQEVNNGLRKELSSLRSTVDEHTSHKSDFSKQLDQLNKDYQKILQEQAVVKHQLSESMKATKEAKSNQDKLSQEIIQLRMERDIKCGKVIVLEEEIQHQQQSYNNLLKEQQHLVKDKAEQDQRLQREIHDRLCLKMVNDLLKEESAHVKEAFQKLEEFTSSMEQKSKALGNQQESMSDFNEEMAGLKSWNGDLLLKNANAKSHCEDLQSQLSSLNDTNKLLKMEKEDTERQLQLIKMREDALTKLQVSKSKELTTENDSLKLSLNTISKRNEELEDQSEYQKKEIENLKEKFGEVSSSATERGTRSIHFLQEEVDKIKNTVASLESEKTDLISEVNKLHKEGEVWTLQRSELEMTLAELSAENSQLRNELQTKLMPNDTESSTADFTNKFELEKEEAVRKAKEDVKESFDEVCLELKTVKSELSKVWEMLEVKEKLLEDQSQELQQEQDQSQKLAEELIRLRKDYCELTTKTASRNQMICTLRDELMQSCQEVTELETALSSVKQQKCKTLEKTPKKCKIRPELTRRRSDSDISKSLCQSCVNTCKECNEREKMTALNTHLNQRAEELMAERDSALQDSQDLLNGMQQLREAFEEEMERELERERTNFEREKKLLQNAKRKEDNEQSFGAKSKLEAKVTLLTEEKITLEVKSKNLECERDELRNQVEELCRMRTAAEEKAVQVDPALSPRKRESKTTLRKRSKSVGMLTPANDYPGNTLQLPQQ